MIDSCSPRKLWPGLAQMYSKPSDFRMSTMKSEPVRPCVSSSTRVPAPSCAAGTDALAGAGAVCALASTACDVSATAPVAACFKNSRRSTCVSCDLATDARFLGDGLERCYNNPGDGPT